MYSNGLMRVLAKEGQTQNRWVVIRVPAAMAVAAVCGSREKVGETQEEKPK